LPEDVRNILAGVSLNGRELSETDINLLLAGKQLSDATRHTREIPIQVIQTIGRCLSTGMSRRETARSVRCSFETVDRIDILLGLSQAYEDKMLDLAVVGVREGKSVRKFAVENAIARSTSHRLLTKARKVLVELGEIDADA
jgi:transposase-like protein